jgi:hypothetical protein
VSPHPVQNGLTPLLVAIKRGHPGVVQALLSGGADPTWAEEVRGCRLRAAYMRQPRWHCAMHRGVISVRAGPGDALGGSSCGWLCGISQGPPGCGRQPKHQGLGEKADGSIHAACACA